MRNLYMSHDGTVSAKGLDDLEIKIFADLTKGQFSNKHLCRTAVEAVAVRLGFEIVNVEEIEKPVQGVSSPFSWLDLRYGSGNYRTTPDPEERTVNFTLDKGVLDPDDEKHRSKCLEKANCFHPFAQDLVPGDGYYRVPDEGFPEPYYYKLDPAGLTSIEIDLIEMFLPEKYRAGGSRFDRFFKMNLEATAELCRRLGLKPIFEEAPVKEDTGS